jgi:hypothetical protein
MRKIDLIKDPTLWALIGLVVMLTVIISGN